jgi:hypothetical protein
VSRLASYQHKPRRKQTDIVVETLGGLERELKHVLQQVQNGIKSLQPKSEDSK